MDGSSYLYRAFHAMPDLRNAQGEPTGAIYGVVNMMRKLLHDYQAQYAACVFDVRGKTFREDLYPEYKSHRPPMPEELAAQIEPIHAAIRAMGWPVLGVQGVEADDVIGSLAHWATDHDVHTVISTGDKDLAQLVTPHVTLVNTMSGEKLDPEGVVRKFGVPPERIVDYLMLVGDTVDNVPGVHKVGPKTAAKWISEFGSVDGLVEHAAEIKGVAGENLRAAISQFPLTRELLTVKIDCDLKADVPDIASLTPQPIDRDALIALFERYGFRTWLRELTADDARVPIGDTRVAPEATRPAAPSQNDYQTITDLGALDAWMVRVKAAPCVALDTETTTLEPLQARLVGISLSTEPGVACYIPVAHRGPDAGGQLPRAEVLARMKSWLEGDSPTKLLHHAKYDTHVFANEGIDLRGVADDTMLQAYVLESHKGVGLADLAQRWLGLKGVSVEDLCGKGVHQLCFDQVDIDRASHYACEDVDFTLRLHALLRPKVREEDKLEAIYQLEMKVSRTLWEIERNGVMVDAAECGLERDEFLDRMTHKRVGTGVHYLSVAGHPYYQQRFGWRAEQWPNALRIGQRTVSLPLSPKLDAADVERIITTVRDVLQRA